MDKILSLDLIAAHLEGLEETIITKFIDRVQYKANGTIYRKGESGFQGQETSSLLDIRLRIQEEMDTQFGRYRQPEERPFTTNLKDPKRIVNIPEKGLHINNLDKLNVTSQILESYLQFFIGDICCDGDDGQYGSSVVADVYALQAISERVHYGAMFVAEAKYCSDPEGYQKLIDMGDVNGLMNKLTRKEVEDRIIKRVRDKVAYVQAHVNTQVRRLIDPEIVITYYRNCIIPLTKKGEIKYLMERGM